jgi:carbamoyl-phosphate synthase large subunit
MEIVYTEDKLEEYILSAVKASPEYPVLIDKFLEGAIEVDVDAVADGTGNVLIGGVMEHIEEAGVHSGDSACVIPPYTLGEDVVRKIKECTEMLARELNVTGLINIQFAVKGDEIYVLEVNPRASRTVPFVSKAVGIPLAKIAAKVMVGQTLEKMGLIEMVEPRHICVKEAVLPFGRFPGVDTVLGPEMKSTGEVMGIDKSFGQAYAKAQISSGFDLPRGGKIFVSVCNNDKRAIIPVAKQLADLGFEIVSTKGTAEILKRNGIKVSVAKKVHEGRPNVVDYIKNGQIGLIINTPWGKGTRSDGYEIRTAAAAYGVPCITTIPAATAVLQGIEALLAHEMSVKALQDYHRRIKLKVKKRQEGKLLETEIKKTHQLSIIDILD